ncbi:MAG: patatin-like phospholipase family protein [Betaproteobacteria bacterium]|nr:patatin-like phospholipase family protein [Betaproteobacteria bacterium]
MPRPGGVPRKARGSRARKPPIGLALAGGGPFGAVYEIGALLALQDSLEGLDFNELDVYVGVSAGSFLSAALANGIPVSEIYGLFIEDGEVEGALTPEVFMRPAFAEYLARARSVPPILAKSIVNYVTRPFGRGALESFAALGRAIPTGIFDNDTIHRYLQAVFTRPGRTDDFRQLSRKLYLVATDLDTGESVSFGRPGHDHVPISKAVQASAALPGLFPPVEIDGHHFVDGALKKTLHASEALDDGARLVICVNPIVPYDASLATEKGRGRHSRLVEGGLPVVLSQTFRAIIHSRMATGLSKYRTQYRGADVILFEPDADDSEIFFTNIFGYATRQRLCEHAYARTRRDLLKRRSTLEPILARHGIRMKVDVLEDPDRRLSMRLGRPANRSPAPWRLPGAAADLRETLVDLRRWIARDPPAA